MMKQNKFKIGAASFYVVAFSTLILVIIASSFATAIIMEMARSSNDDLAQSAYDAAVAGVEDAKAAFINYQNCLNAGVTTAKDPTTDGNDLVSCENILWWMDHPDCDMVGHILGRIGKRDSGSGVTVSESVDVNDPNNNMQQAYTCTIVQTKLNDYRADLNAVNPYRVVKIQLADGADASDIGAVRVSWYSYRDGNTGMIYNNVTNNGEVGFQSLNSADPATPPMLSVQLMQTARDGFNLSQLNGKTAGSSTDRATVYLTPTNSAEMASGNKGERKNEWTYIGAYASDSGNRISAAELASTNDHSKDYPYAVYCPENSASEYACSVVLDLPNPIGSDKRHNDTFMFVVALPYGQPATDFSLELICKDGTSACATGENGESLNIAKMDRMQVMVDSTGKASDLFRRVEMRFEPSDNAFGFPFYAVQVDEDFEKDLQVTTEWSEGTYDAALNNL